MAVRLLDIAEAAGVSLPTVSHIINAQSGRAARFRPETREKVLTAARNLGYRPNTAARSVATGRFENVGLLLSTRQGHSRVSEAMLAGMHDALAELEFSLTLIRLPDEQLTEETRIPRLLRERGCDGLLVDYTHGIPQPMVDLIEGHEIPAIWLNTKRKTDAIYPDDHGAGRLAADYLLRRGHRRIVYLSHLVGPDETHYSATDRAAGYAQAMSDAGAEPVVITQLRSPDRIAWLAAQLKAGTIDAVVCYGEKMVAETVAAAYAVGVDPAELGLVVFGEQPVEIGVSVPLIRIPGEAMGREAVVALRGKIEQPERALPSRALPFDLMETPDRKPE